MIQTDLAIIGSGPGGYITAIRAAKMGLDTTVIEKDKLGGVCLNWGCMPTKWLYHLAQEVDSLKKVSDMGITVDSFTLDYAAAVKKMQNMVGKLSRSIQHHFKTHNIKLIKAEASFDSQARLTAGGQKIKAKNIIIAAGSSPASVAPFELDQKYILSNRDLLQLKEIPSSLAIIGGGIVGMEFAYIFSALGSQVTIVEVLPSILGSEDREVSELITALYEEKGIKILTSTNIKGVDIKKSGLILTTDKGHTIEAEKALVSVGRKPNTEGLNLDGAKVRQDSKGYIEVDRFGATTAPGIYAIGDINGKYPLAHVAAAEGKIAVDHILGVEKILNYQAVPYAIFTSPQIGAMGLTEKQAQQKAGEIKVGRFPFTHNGRALIDGHTAGFTKVITDASTGEILGAHIIGPDAGELIHVMALAKSSELLAEDIIANIYAHPTLSESLLEAGEDVFGLATHI
ncbi:MAG: dihydrolipoyl dehydrogenase [Actinomycetota bacterium]|nr:dihydrolipoyl dehydrogenase [Actinomycetota bacterium]